MINCRNIDDLIEVVGEGVREDVLKKNQDSILPKKNIQDRAKRYSTLCIRGEENDRIASRKKK